MRDGAPQVPTRSPLVPASKSNLPVKILLQKPIVIASLQATGIALLSNALAQLIQGYRVKLPFDLPELIRFTVLSLIVSPPNYLWQVLLEDRFPAYTFPANYERCPEDVLLEESVDLENDTPRENGSNWRNGRLNFTNTALKLLLDCFTIGILVNTVVFLLLMGLFKGLNVAQISDTILSQTIPIMIASYKIWPIAAVFVFCLVPVEKRLVFYSIVGLIWGIYLSLVSLDI